MAGFDFPVQSWYFDDFNFTPGQQRMNDNYLSGLLAYNNRTDALNNLTSAYNKNTSALESKNTITAGIGGFNAAMQGISTIGGLVMSVKNYQMQKDALNKQKELIDEQINASKENRAQRRAEIARMNKVRSNTNKMFNNSAVVSRSY